MQIITFTPANALPIVLEDQLIKLANECFQANANGNYTLAYSLHDQMLQLAVAHCPKYNATVSLNFVLGQ